MNRVIHFEIPTDNPPAALEFYEGVFGWSFQKWEGPEEYWLVRTGDPQRPGIDGGMMKRPRGPGAVTVNTIEVPSLAKTMAEVEKRGGKIVVEKREIPGVGWLAYGADPEGLVFGIMEPALPAR
jgi:predicted enzyme related to lactoylglutathione lyase